MKWETNLRRAYLTRSWRRRMTLVRCRKWEMPTQRCQFSPFPSSSSINSVVFSLPVLNVDYETRHDLINSRPFIRSAGRCSCRIIRTRAPLFLIIAPRNRTARDDDDEIRPAVSAWPEVASLLFPVSYQWRRWPWIWWRISKLPAPLIASCQLPQNLAKCNILHSWQTAHSLHFLCYILCWTCSLIPVVSSTITKT